MTTIKENQLALALSLIDGLETHLKNHPPIKTIRAILMKMLMKNKEWNTKLVKNVKEE